MPGRSPGARSTAIGVTSALGVTAAIEVFAVRSSRRSSALVPETPPMIGNTRRSCRRERNHSSPTNPCTRRHRRGRAVGPGRCLGGGRLREGLRCPLGVGRSARGRDRGDREGDECRLLQQVLPCTLHVVMSALSCLRGCPPPRFGGPPHSDTTSGRTPGKCRTSHSRPFRRAAWQNATTTTLPVHAP